MDTDIGGTRKKETIEKEEVCTNGSTIRCGKARKSAEGYASEGLDGVSENCRTNKARDELKEEREEEKIDRGRDRENNERAIYPPQSCATMIHPCRAKCSMQQLRVRICSSKEINSDASGLSLKPWPSQSSAYTSWPSSTRPPMMFLHMNDQLGFPCSSRSFFPDLVCPRTGFSCITFTHVPSTMNLFMCGRHRVFVTHSRSSSSNWECLN